MIRWSITGTRTSALARCWATARSVSSGSNFRRSTSVEASGRPSVKWAKPQEWNIGAAIIVVSRARSGIFENSAATGSSESGCLRGGALRGCRSCPEVRITTRPLARRGGVEFGAVAACDQLLSSGSSVAAGGSPAQATKRLRPAAPARDEPGELLVVDDGDGVLAREHVGDLRAGEGRVQVQRAGAELRAGDGRFDEAAVVAAHDRDAVPFAYAGRRERAGERVGAPRATSANVRRPALVDDRRAVRVADRRADVGGRRRRSPALQAASGAQRPVGAHRARSSPCPAAS